MHILRSKLVSAHALPIADQLDVTRLPFPRVSKTTRQVMQAYTVALAAGQSMHFTNSIFGVQFKPILANEAWRRTTFGNSVLYTGLTSRQTLLIIGAERRNPSADSPPVPTRSPTRPPADVDSRDGAESCSGFGSESGSGFGSESGSGFGFGAGSESGDGDGKSSSSTGTPA